MSRKAAVVVVRKKPNRSFVSTLQLILSPILHQADRAERDARASVRHNDGLVSPRLLSPRVRRLARAFQYHKAQAAGISSTFDGLGYDVDDEGAITTSWRVRQERRAAAVDRAQAATEQINAVRARAMVDLLDMDPKAAQAYLRKVER